ncbi:MAG: carbohydrate-binding protein [Nitrospirales bacterium]
MQKRFICHVQQGTEPLGEDWLNVEGLAEVEITTEDAAHPIESALLPGRASGWRAAGPWKQTIRLLFAAPQRRRRIWVHFVEARTGRTQEYVLRWSPDGGESFRVIVRQQWNFSPEGATSQSEDHHVDLPAVMVLELTIIPDSSGGNAFASLEQMRLA